MAAPQLQHLMILRCLEMDLSATGDPQLGVRFLQISYYERLVSSAAFINSQFQGLTRLTIYGECKSVNCLPKKGWLPASLESLELNRIESVETLECKGLAHLTSLQTLDISFCPKLENMKGEKLPDSLIRLTIYETPLLGKLCEMKDPQLIHGANQIKSANKVFLLTHQKYSIILMNRGKLLTRFRVPAKIQAFTENGTLTVVAFK
ncbi:hypothetical protein PIB30_050396 [Stylosanthes scabra]|uniref:Uncharacterized protein n=1 Tax=Stylosanthes scabra TaxID=79078 RepID=A0ABU6UHY6_9FABA|nr:hypothetical protein [Stylosanthes scabra]